MRALVGNPLHTLLHEHMGIDSFSLDGDATAIVEPWQDRPARARTPLQR